MQKTDFSVSQGGIMTVTELLVRADVLFLWQGHFFWPGWTKRLDIAEGKRCE